MVVQSSPSGYGPLNLALFDLGMVPWAGLSRGRATGTSFGSLCHFRIILGSFWDDFRIILGGPWGVPGGSLGGSWGSPGVSGTGPAPGTQKLSKVCNCAQKQAYHIGPARRATGFWDHPGSPYLTPLEPYSVPLLGNIVSKTQFATTMYVWTRTTFPKIPRWSCLGWEGQGPFLRCFSSFRFLMAENISLAGGPKRRETYNTIPQ